MARDIGFDPVDAGPLQKPRLLKPLGYFCAARLFLLGYVVGLGTSIGLKLVHC